MNYTDVNSGCTMQRTTIRRSKGKSRATEKLLRGEGARIMSLILLIVAIGLQTRNAEATGFLSSQRTGIEYHYGISKILIDDLTATRSEQASRRARRDRSKGRKKRSKDLGADEFKSLASSRGAGRGKKKQKSGKKSSRYVGSGSFLSKDSKQKRKKKKG
eukprot:CAMPEP_0113581088 /NCGR_PEP_ID=MMETSP0015_2-20120614/31067_1 /TAXON_ID=2838 /ORGANISM="Odontella" /LENGTH=159 /DNA_ID=CAMNT_0000485415 /DNA_START=127 /DNA_END=602 /DNA_ORIENTATION=- /assembly_acc=CAM_ASM_000160